MKNHTGRPKEAGVRELKTRASEMLAQVRQGQRYIITHRGRPVALLAPIAPYPAAEAPDNGWDQLQAVGSEIEAAWRSPQSSLEILAEVRRK